MAKLKKTIVMRLLDQAKIPYTAHTYSDTEAISGVEVASVLGQDVACVFKTLVTEGVRTSITRITTPRKIIDTAERKSPFLADQAVMPAR